ncbi:hypothetical protein, partial [uncultured Parasutterella sp.]|uniref:hypothetical protein n=1 Tax=uncultured Parasutterella sp. TaxID=1263098 RepID=UPI002623CB7D
TKTLFSSLAYICRLAIEFRSRSSLNPLLFSEVAKAKVHKKEKKIIQREKSVCRPLLSSPIRKRKIRQKILDSEVVQSFLFFPPIRGYQKKPSNLKILPYEINQSQF